MPISTVTNRVEYQGDGTSAIFAFSSKVNAQSDIGVFGFNSSATSPGSVTPFTLNAGGAFGYTISGNQDPSGVYPNGFNLILNSSPNPQTVIVLFRSSVLTNAFSVGQTGVISSTGLNNELDYLTMIAQRHQDQITRALRLHDGVAGSFDMSLPKDIRSNPGKFLVTNSNANGWILSDPNGGQYIPNTVIVAQNSSALASLGGAPTGYILQSQGSSAPSWQQISFGSGPVPSGAIIGVLNVAQGGTGTGTSYIQYGVVFASSAFQMANTQAGGGDVPLLGNAGLAPSFRALPLSSGSSVTGTLPIVKGGTGNATPLNTNEVIIAASATAMGSVANGSQGQVLTANSGLAPTYQSLPPANLTAGSGILPVANGGTGVPSLVPQFGLLYASSATQVAVVPSAAAGRVLTANGSSAPSFQAFTAAPITITNVSANYGAGATDGLILANSSNYTINLPPATGNAGTELRIRRTTPFLNSSITISESSIVTTLNTQLEELRVISDGATWVPDRFIHAVGTSFVATANWTGTSSINTGFWERFSNKATIRHFLLLAGTPIGSTILQLNLPQGMLLDINELTSRSAFQTPNFGRVSLFDVSIPRTFEAEVIYVGTTSVSVNGIEASLTTGYVSRFGTTLNIPIPFSSSDIIVATYSVPIQGWSK
jgi:hypothetical protein